MPLCEKECNRLGAARPGRYIQEDGILVPSAVWKQSNTEEIEEDGFDIVARFNSDYDLFHFDDTPVNISGRLSFKYVVVSNVFVDLSSYMNSRTA